MLSKNRVNFIISLQKKKIREEEKLYVIEGDKIVREFITAGIPIKSLIAKPEFLSTIPVNDRKLIDEIVPATYEELKKVSSLKTPHNAMALVYKQDKHFDYNKIDSVLSLALDSVQDPGNMGTIMRSAAWFGIENIFCSPDCADLYNPKVIQSGMGAILHVNVFSVDLKELLENALLKNVRIFGAFLEGHSIYTHKLDPAGIILLGNESKGISDTLKPFVTDKIMIPGKGSNRPGIDSLNVGMAASIVFSEFARQNSHPKK